MLRVIASDLDRLEKAKRRERAQLTQSSSLLDLSTTARKDQHAAGTQRPGTTAKLVPNRQSSEARDLGDLSTGGFNTRQRRATLNVATSRKLPRTLLSVVVPFLADRTIGRAFGTLCRLSVCMSSVCDVLYCGETVCPSEKVSEGVNRKPGS